MKKLQEFINKYRHILAMLAILAVSVAVLGWVGYDSLPQAAMKSERVIVNDDYSTLTDAITDSEGVKQNIFVKKGTRLYGISMNFHIFNRVQFGTVHVDLLDTAGNVIATSQRDMTAILDNTFKGFIFDKMQYSANEDMEYIVHVWIQPQTAEDRIALWRSESGYDGFEMTVNGQQAPGTVALQYINRHVGRSIYGWYAIFAVLAIAGLELLYLAVFVLKAKTHTVFAVAALFMGMIFSWFTPINGGPDEYVHLSSAYRISNQILNWGDGAVSNNPADNLLVRSCDAVVKYNSTVEYNAFSFGDMYDGLITSPEESVKSGTFVQARFAEVFKPLYFAQALGITVARLLQLGFVPMVLMGRLFNLLQYTILIYFAIKLMPVYKTTMALVALLPMGMQIAGNFAYDAYVIAMAFLFTALVFRLTYGKEKIDYKDLIAPAIVLCLLAPAKTIYILMGLLVFMLPAKKFPDKKKAQIAKIAVLIVAAVFWITTNLSTVLGTLRPRASAVPQTETVTVTAGETQNDVIQKALLYPYEIWLADSPAEEAPVFWDPNSDLLPNGDSRYYYSIPYILQNIKGTIKLVMRTITTHTGKYLQTVVGTRLGEIIVVDLQASWIWFMALVVMLYMSVTPVKGVKETHTMPNKLLGVLVFILVTGRTVAACIMWTPINYETIFGIQGRYLLPALPVFMMALGCKNLQLQKSIDRLLLWCILPVDILVVLNVFMIMTSNK